QQQQLQQQQQQAQASGKQTVASSILYDPEPQRGRVAAGAAPAAPSAGGPSRGTLIVRANEAPSAQAIAPVMERLNVIVRVLDRRSPGDSSMIDQLNSQSGSRFVLMLVDANQHANADDLF